MLGPFQKEGNLISKVTSVDLIYEKGQMSAELYILTAILGF